MGEYFTDRRTVYQRTVVLQVDFEKAQETPKEQIPIKASLIDDWHVFNELALFLTDLDENRRVRIDDIELRQADLPTIMCAGVALEVKDLINCDLNNDGLHKANKICRHVAEMLRSVRTFLNFLKCLRQNNSAADVKYTVNIDTKDKDSIKVRVTLAFFRIAIEFSCDSGFVIQGVKSRPAHEELDFLKGKNLAGLKKCGDVTGFSEELKLDGGKNNIFILELLHAAVEYAQLCGLDFKMISHNYRDEDPVKRKREKSISDYWELNSNPRDLVACVGADIGAEIGDVIQKVV